MTYGQIALWLVSLKFSGFHGVIVGGGILGVCNTSMDMYVICICVMSIAHAVNSCPSVHARLVNQMYF